MGAMEAMKAVVTLADTVHFDVILMSPQTLNFIKEKPDWLKCIGY